MKKVFYFGTLMLFLCFVINVCAESTLTYSTPEGTLTYSIVNEKIYIQSYRGRDTILEIPETIDGRPVYSVHLYADEQNSDVREIRLPSTVRELPFMSMSYFTELKKITGTENIETLAGYNFESTKIKQLVFSENLQRIGVGAFASMRDIISLTIPDDCEIETTQCFYSTFSLQKINLIHTGNEPTLTLDGPALFTADMKTLIVYPCGSSQVSYRIPDGVETIEEFAFCMLQSFDGGLTDVVIPASVKNISPFRQFSYGGGARSLLPHLHVYEGSAAHRMVIDQDYDPLDYYVIPEGGDAVTVDDRIDEIIQKYTHSGMTDYEKAFGVYRWFAENTSYDFSFSMYLADDVLLHGTGVCQSYMLAYQLILNKLGLPNYYVVMPGINHGCNAVKLDGVWCFVDCTWSTVEPSYGYYFGMSADMLQFTHGTEGYHDFILALKRERGIVPEPPVNYYDVRQGMYDSLIERYAEEIIQAVWAGQTQYSVTLPNSTDSLTLCILAGMLPGTVHSTDPSITINCEYSTDTLVLTAKIAATGIHHTENGVCPTCGQTFSTEGMTVLTLPKALQTIEAEAFCGVSAEAIVIPDGCTSVGSRAFVDCANLRFIFLPESLMASWPEDAVAQDGSVQFVCRKDAETEKNMAHHFDLMK